MLSNKMPSIALNPQIVLYNIGATLKFESICNKFEMFTIKIYSHVNLKNIGRKIRHLLRS